MKAAFQANLNTEFEAGKDYKPNKADWLDGKWSHLDRNKDDISAAKPRSSQKHRRNRHRTQHSPRRFPCPQNSWPSCWTAKPRCLNPVEGFDWATGEALAFGSLLPKAILYASPVKTAHAAPSRQRHSGLDQPRHRRAVSTHSTASAQVKHSMKSSTPCCLNMRCLDLSTATHWQNQTR